jgi:HK97 family phage major capsid protein
MPLTTQEYQQFLQTVHQIRDVFEQLQNDMKKLGSESGELKEQQARLETTLQRYEAAMQRPTVPTPEASGATQLSAFLKAVRYGYRHLDDGEKKMIPLASLTDNPPIPGAIMEQKGLYVSEDTAGGFLAPPEFTTDIIKAWIPYSPIRDYVRVRQTSNRSIQQPKRNATITAQWVGEKTTRTELTGYSLGRIEIPTNEMYALVLVSEQDLEDTQFDLEGELRGEFSEQFGVAEGKALLTGDASMQPQGILTHPSIAIDKSGTNGVITPDTLVSHVYNILDPYVNNARMYFKRTTLGAIRQLKDSQNRYLWEPGLNGAEAATILGMPYTTLPDMPSVGTGANIILTGDVNRGYTLVQRVGITFKRLAERYVENSQIGIYARMRIGGQVVLPEAMRIYQTGV